MKITWGALVTDGKGKLGGHAAQKGRTGSVLRTIGRNRIGASRAQSLQRANVQLISQSWHDLTNEERQSWINAAENSQSGFDLYMEINLRLLSSGLTILTLYVAPVANNYITTPLVPWNSSDYEPENPGFYMYQTNYFYTFIPNEWIPNILWSGWVAPSISSFPSMKKKIKQSAIRSFPNFIEIYFRAIPEAETPPPDPSYKAKFDLGFVNIHTGQRFSQKVFETSAITTDGPVIPYSASIQFTSFSITPVMGGYDLAAGFLSDNDNLDFDIWEPWWFMSNWYPMGDPESVPIVNYINPSLFTFVDSSHMELDIPASEGSPLAAPGPDYFALVQYGWKNTSTGELSSEGNLTFYTS